ncbi:MAG: hypothetical protein VXZ99_12850, partial [Pseudomonadota bacterium]|nr:hypothetical protein [Pseudomonadota bacterium]
PAADAAGSYCTMRFQKIPANAYDTVAATMANWPGIGPSNPLSVYGPVKNAAPPNPAATPPRLDHVIFSSVVK